MLFVLIGDSEVGYQKTKSCFNLSSKLLTEQQSSCLLIGKKFSNYFLSLFLNIIARCGNV